MKRQLIVTVKNEVVRASGQAARPPERELGGPPVAVQDKNRLHSRNRSIFFGPEARTISTIAHRTLNFEHASICSPSQFARLHGSSNGSASREIRFFVRATAYERHFRCRAQAHSAIFFFGTRSRSSSERACWIGDVRSVFVFCFCFPMFVYLLKTLPYCTYPSRVESIQQAP